MRYGATSDRGMMRENNEDCYNIVVRDGSPMFAFIIADGMGGHNSGEIASSLAVEVVSRQINEYSGEFTDDEAASDALRKIIHKANLEVFSSSNDKNDNYGMGTTLTIAVVNNDKIYIGHVGDSRMYVLRNGEMSRLTTDHSLIEELLQNGSITKEEADNHPRRNVITRAVGCFKDIDVDIYVYDMKPEDAYILCTDGLTNMLSEKEIMNIVDGCDAPQTACDELVRAANEKGGEDNITAIEFKAD